jgi:uncharacterized protein YjiS (DUF1127 family)
MAARIQLDFPAASDPAFRGVPRHVSTAGLIPWISAAAARWQQRRLLRELDERMLHDIGISRSQALVESLKPWWRP